MENFGPFLAEGDLAGNSLFERENAKIAPGLKQLYAGTRSATLRRYGETDDKTAEAIWDGRSCMARGETETMSSIPAKASIRERATTELREFVIIALYLYICFSALAYLKAAILQAQGIPFAPFAFAAVKALICAKFVLVGRALHLGERFKALPLIWPTLHRSFMFLVLLIILNVLEEIVVGYIHHRGVADSLADFGGGTLDQLVATSVVVLLILIPFFAFRSLGEVVGERNLVRVFFLQRHNIDAG